MSPTTPPPDPWGQRGQIATTAFALTASSLAVLRWIIRPFFDSAVVSSIVRRSPDVEKHFRNEVFRKDLERAADTRELLEHASRIAEANALAIAELVKGLDRVETEQRDSRQVLERIVGVLDEMRRQSLGPTDVGHFTL